MEMSQRRVLVLPRSGVHEVLRNLGFEAEVQFCGKLGVLLDREETGMICFDRLLHFIANATDTERAPPRPLSSLEEECFNQLEWQLSREFCQMLATRHSRATTESWRRRELCSESATPPGTPRNAAATTPRAATPRSRAATPRNGTPRSPSPGVARCHLLYHQAVFAARKGAQLEERVSELDLSGRSGHCCWPVRDLRHVTGPVGKGPMGSLGYRVSEVDSSCLRPLGEEGPFCHRTRSSS